MTVLSRSFLINKLWSGESLPPRDNAEVSIEFDAHEFRIFIDAPFHDDPKPPAAVGYTPRLWEYEVVEVFLVGDDGQYLELEFGPYGHYLMLWLSGPRVVTPRPLTCTYSITSRSSRWTAVAMCARSALPKSIARINLFAIAGVADQRRYMAWHPLPGAEPDFHQPGRFPLF